MKYVFTRWDVGNISMALAAGMAMLDCWLHHFQQLVKEKKKKRMKEKPAETIEPAWKHEQN